MSVQGDLDREFLGRDVIPYQQLFRADLKVSTEKKGKLKFNLSELQVSRMYVAAPPQH